MVYIVWPSLTFPEHLVYELLKAHLEKEEQRIFLCVCGQSLKSRPTLCDLMDCSQPGSSVHGILQARILGWVAISSPGDLPNPGVEPGSREAPHWQVGSLPLICPGSPRFSGTRGVLIMKSFIVTQYFCLFKHNNTCWPWYIAAV